MTIMQGSAGTLDPFQDIGGFGRPDKRLRLVIMMGNVLVDGDNQFLDAAKSPAAYAN